MKAASICRQARCHTGRLKETTRLYRPHEGVRWKSSAAVVGGPSVEHAFEPTTPERRKKLRIRYISTLDPARLTAHDVVEILHTKRPSFRPHDQFNTYYPSFQLDRPFDFPPYTRGFLYYHADSGDLRFRVTPDSNTASFDAGVDLKDKNGIRPWSYNLKNIAKSPRLVSLREALQRDGLLSLDDVNVAKSSKSGQPSGSKKKRSPAFLSTLNPSVLNAQDFIDVSGLSHITFRLGLHTEDIEFTYHSAGIQSFPPGTHGFLYYHSPAPPIVPLGGGLRFRVTQDSDPASFTAGSDAKSTRGLVPWSLPLWSIAKNPKYQPIRAQLLHEKLVTQDTLDKVERASKGLYSLKQYFVLYHLNQEFALDLQGTARSLWAMGAERNEGFVLSQLWSDKRRVRKSIVENRLGTREVVARPFRGKVRVRFERSSFPEHANQRVAVLRIIKIIEPVQCIAPDNDSGTAVAPNEGDFVYRMNTRYGVKHPMAFDIDTPPYHALRLLW